MSKLLTIGLTGPTGAGKTSLRGFWEAHGCRLVDCDRLAREIVLPGTAALGELADAFGRDIINKDGSLNRPLLAQRAFSTAQSSAALCAITHPRILRLAEEESRLLHADGFHAVIDAPVLFESGGERMCDFVVAVLAPAEMRLQRIMKRDGLTEQQARLRMSAQQPDEFYRERADYVLLNDRSAAQLEQAAEQLLGPLLN